MHFHLTKSSTALLVFAVLLTTATSETRARDFDRLNNDFGWKHLPCSFLNENTVYMILTAFCMNFFTYFISAVSSVFTSLSPTSKIKKFVFHFTAVCAKWTRTARRWWHTVRHNICISDAQYYELSAQQNLWCEILEF